VSAEERVALAFAEEHPLDSARLLERIDPGSTAALLARLPASVAASVLRQLAPSAATACVSALPDDALAALVEVLPLDAAASTLRSTDDERRERLLSLLRTEQRNHLSELLAHGEHTAGALADPLVLALPDDLTVAAAQEQLRGSRQHLFYYVYVVTRERTLIGVLALPELMAAPAHDTLALVMHRNVVSLDARTNLVTVAVHPAWRDFDALPVVDSSGKLLGAIRHKAIRQMSGRARAPMMATLVGLSELYWSGLSGILASLAPAQNRAQEDEHVA
jgi:magnesium transporter